MMNLPNILTISRILILPVIIALFLMEGRLGATAMWWAFGLYAVACITDFLDGWIARKLNQTTAFGTFLDPISDKIFVGALFIVFAGVGRIYGIWMIPAIVIFAREFLVSGLREYLGQKSIALPVTKLAKWKTTSQMVATGILIIGPYVPYGLSVGHWALTLAALITVITGWGYMKAGLDHMRKMT
ncbi:MAG: CDP-diacylglycerol--glycerol-3-phosphate 3-phosphatidyltransferase [Alphaproteobacteria bacterium]